MWYGSFYFYRIGVYTNPRLQLKKFTTFLFGCKGKTMIYGTIGVHRSLYIGLEIGPVRVLLYR